MANLILDIGNSLQKIALFFNGELVSTVRSASIQLSDIDSVIGTKDVKYAIISETGVLEEKIREHITSHFKTIFLTPKTKLPIEILYETPERLGNDRIAAVVAAQHYFPGKDILVIQAGTCLVFDFLNSKGQYLGGAISPGVNMRFKALHTFTAKLPHIAPDYNIPETEFIGSSTELSIRNGVINGIIDEINSEIERYTNTFPQLKVVFTGGDMPHLKKSIKNTIFANSNLVLEGLNKILDINVNQK